MLRSISALLLCALPAFASDVTVLTARRVHTLTAEREPVDAIAWDSTGRLLATGTSASLAARFRVLSTWIDGERVYQRE